jgi:twitching motility protein PilJ
MAETTTAAGRQTRLLFGLLFGALALIVLSSLVFFSTTQQDDQEQKWREQIRQLGDDSLALSTIADGISRGVAPDFLGLLSGIEEVQFILEGLAKGAPVIGLRPLPESVAPELRVTREASDRLSATLTAVLEGEQAFATLTLQRSTVVATMDTVAVQALEVLDAAQQRGATAAANAGRQLARVERLRATLPRLTSEGADAAEYGQSLADDWAALKALQPELRGLPAPQSQIAAALQEVDEAVATIVANSRAVEDLQSNAAISRGQSRDVLANVRALEQAVVSRVGGIGWLPLASGIGLLVGIAGVVLFVVLFLVGARRRAERAARREAQQQQAILGLLDEITNLADGDLTVDVTVTEDFTGAIADSLNYTVQNIRELVGTITRSSERLDTGATATRQLAQRMATGSERQASEIATLTQQMVETANTLTTVAERAEGVARQAEESVDVARSGAETATGTIKLMSALRDQIQDTSKRIKRLGESSQEIGNIIELINDIAEQTGTLALNASIQAAMAGEQGRGFAVVAEEVQRLAERASSATRQVETLVNTIQADTNEAMVSMERSTVNVVSGARSAEDAGGALTRVQRSSQTMAELIAEIAGDARQQSAGTTAVARQMQGIREVSTQTSRSSTETAAAVDELAQLSTALRQSVAGFKLPDAE